ncbi:hypothetical protein MUK42_02607 [Musa troglodytarum]|uniref:Uncharacterized protein n=1 Tax=Musa troglodytarum TaxID=320322 RepID=A0A9E7EM80_9LILI|nr:hypothetical protein MUK42_02607 [Musa troglodytarum]
MDPANCAMPAALGTSPAACFRSTGRLRLLHP